MSLRRLNINTHRSSLDALYRLTDATSIVAGMLLAIWLTGRLLPSSEAMFGAGGLTLYFVVGEFTGLYRNWRGVRTDSESLTSLATWGVTVLGMSLAAFFIRSAAAYPRTLLFTWFLTAPLLIVFSRALIRFVLKSLRAHGFNSRGFAIVGVNELGQQLARNIEKAPELGLNLVGFYDDRPQERTADLDESVGSHVGNLDELVRQAREGDVEMIYITFPMRAEERIKEVLSRLADSTASVYVVPDFFVFELMHSRWTNIGGLPAVSVFENPLYGVDGLLKRSVDLLLTWSLLLVLAVPMAVVAALIKLSSPGPVFFRQRRYGLDGREILVWKFRTMRVCEDGDQVVQASRTDSRITPLGAVLRRTSLDELPQLFNVLAGTMSLVGPRPHATAHNEQYRELIQGYMLRHKIKPGITGLAQVSGYRGETDTLDKMERRVECDHQYIREWSLWLDLKILFRTIFVVFSGHNAY